MLICAIEILNITLHYIRCMFNVVSTHTVNLPLHKINSTNFINRHIGYISVQALHFRLVSCEGARLYC